MNYLHVSVFGRTFETVEEFSAAVVIDYVLYLWIIVMYCNVSLSIGCSFCCETPGILVHEIQRLLLERQGKEKNILIAQLLKGIV